MVSKNANSHESDMPSSVRMNLRSRRAIAGILCVVQGGIEPMQSGLDSVGGVRRRARCKALSRRGARQGRRSTPAEEVRPFC